ncbi:hypothetical protein OIU83_01825 [Flavobacterium sp. LS1R49]|uniref:Uncharacterized protein n=1 Tax=Flavobacterium shii TaxID=2987687 RepID=A0A9X2YTC7_9FLAO|nr:hypothetical protein [Flavobacterium shii]MCV9926374.1 hypothetical protein [Flavobacterium shii]
MALQTLNTIKNWFRTGLKPTQTQFWDTWDSFRHKYEKIPVADIEGINELLQTKTENEVFENHLNDSNAHAGLIKGKLDKGDYSGTAKDLNDRIEAIGSPDTLLESAKPTRVGAVIKFPAMKYVARINQAIVINTLEYSDAIEVATANYHRIDLIELRADGTLKKIMGDESLTAAIKPNRSSNAVEVSTINVFGNTIYNPSDPFDPTDFLPKGGYNGTGQDLANTIPDLNAPNLKLGGYPNTRNDGQLPTNKILSTDENGNLKMYTIAIAPAPYLDELITESHLPDNTGNLILKGSFFTPTMTVEIQGQTVNYMRFKSDNEVHVNVTTGSAEGSFSVTLDNGISRTFNNVLLIVLGTVYQPIDNNWISQTSVNVSKLGILELNLFGVDCSAILDKNKIPIKANQNFRLQTKYAGSPLGTKYNPSSATIELYRSSDSIKVFTITMTNHYGNGYSDIRIVHDLSGETKLWDFSSTYSTLFENVFRFKRVDNIISYGIGEGTIGRFTATENSEMYAKFITSRFDFVDIKYIETT